MARVDDYLQARQMAARTLAARPAGEIAAAAGISREDGNTLGIRFLNRSYRITWPGCEFEDADGACRPGPRQLFVQGHLEHFQLLSLDGDLLVAPDARGVEGVLEISGLGVLFPFLGGFDQVVAAGSAAGEKLSPPIPLVVAGLAGNAEMLGVGEFDRRPAGLNPFGSLENQAAEGNAQVLPGLTPGDLQSASADHAHAHTQDRYQNLVHPLPPIEK